jgi:hypothetical protein
LTEKILSAVHIVQDYIRTTNFGNQFKSTRAILAYI